MRYPSEPERPVLYAWVRRNPEAWPLAWPLPKKWRFLRVETALKRPASWSLDKVQPLSSPKAVTDFMVELLRDLDQSDRERVFVLFLDTAGRPLGIHAVTIGSASGADMPSKEVFRAAILANATRIVFAHNHPSGSLALSREDENVMHRLQDVAKLLDIEMLDFVVIGLRGAFVSARAMGVL